MITRRCKKKLQLLMNTFYFVHNNSNNVFQVNERKLACFSHYKNT